MQTFEQRVLSMSAKQIIMAMVEALTHPPIINVDMRSFGDVRIVQKARLFGLIPAKTKCFGCAATNTICKISGITLDTSNVECLNKRAQAINSDRDFLSKFEVAINSLRCGSILGYNTALSTTGVAEITNPLDIELPILETNYTNNDLTPYIALADSQ